MLTTHHEVAHVSRPRSRRPDASSDLGQTGRFVEPDARSTVVAAYRQPPLGLSGFSFLKNRCPIGSIAIETRYPCDVRFPLKATELRTWRHISKGQAEAKGLANFIGIAAVDLVGLKIAKGGAQDRSADVSARRVPRHIADRVLAFGGPAIFHVDQHGRPICR